MENSCILTQLFFLSLILKLFASPVRIAKSLQSLGRDSKGCDWNSYLLGNPDLPIPNPKSPIPNSQFPISNPHFPIFAPLKNQIYFGIIQKPL